MQTFSPNYLLNHNDCNVIFLMKIRQMLMNNLNPIETCEQIFEIEMSYYHSFAMKCYAMINENYITL